MTLLIDEVGDLPDAAQLRLLRFLQTQTVSRQGANATRRLNVRVIAATWRDLDEEVRQHRFRLDLLHRLRAGSDLVLPPLRLRQGFFAEVLPELLRRRGHKAAPLITRSASNALELHEWPGNLRELVGVLDQALAFADDDTLRVEHLPSHLQRRYLSVPLHKRALGFLSDELDGQVLDAAHAAWRVAQVQSSLDEIGLPAAPAEATAVQKFLSFLDDTSDEHRAVRDAVEKATDLGRRQAKGELVAEFWRQVLSVDLPPAIRTAVDAHIESISAANAEGQQQLERAQAGVNIEQHPWLSMLNEVAQSPMFRDKRDNVMSTFLGAFNLLRTRCLNPISC